MALDGQLTLHILHPVHLSSSTIFGLPDLSILKMDSGQISRQSTALSLEHFA